MDSKALVLWIASLVLSLSLASGADASTAWKPDIPKVWDEAALREWATPVAGLNVRPGHVPERDYYRLPAEDLRSYPVYYPGREPGGYWDMLQHLGPKRLIEPQYSRPKPTGSPSAGESSRNQIPRNCELTIRR